MIIFKINCIIECFILYLFRLHCFTFSVKNFILSAKDVVTIVLIVLCRQLYEPCCTASKTCFSQN